MSAAKVNCLVLLLLFTPNLLAFGQNTKFNFRMSGEGEPVIVIVTAMGEQLNSWKSNQRRLSSISTVVTYDRMGLGKSAPTDVPRTIANMASELDAFLAFNKIKSPYVLVGHSLGAFIIRKYQNDHPEKVSGMILIDPVHEYQFDSLMARKSEEERVKTEKDREIFVNGLPEGQRKEAILYHEQRGEMMNVKFPGDIPVTILATFRVGPGATIEDRKLKRRLMDGWIARAPQIKLITTEKSGHYIQDDEPELLVDAVEAMIKVLRN
ncbi:MAG TPA: alpha/beta hydrolase [Cyclobacteriaceae bacterium]|nr:alpha/beta hydrolase [Cyclobacteriaceae bacterium]